MKTIIPGVGSWLEGLSRSECAEEKQHQKDSMLEIMLSEKKTGQKNNKQKWQMYRQYGAPLHIQIYIIVTVV